MKNLFFIPFIVAAGILQFSVLADVRIFGTFADLLLGMVVVISLVCPARRAVLLCLFAGMYKDIFGIGGFGINTFLFPVWSVLIVELNKKISLENDYLRSALGFLIGIAQNLAVGIYLIYCGRYISPGNFSRITLFGALCTAAFVPVLSRIGAFFFDGTCGKYFARARAQAMKFARIYIFRKYDQAKGN